MHTEPVRSLVRGVDAESASFVEHVASELDCGPDEAERLAVAVITTLEERLPVDEVQDLEAELPPHVRDLVSATPRILDLPDMDETAFVARVAHKLRMTTDDAENVVRAVFAALRAQLSPREVRRALRL